MTNYVDFKKNLDKNNAKLAKALPNEMKGFGAMHNAALKDGALDPKTKELIALGISIAIRCEPCIVAHTTALIGLGTTRAEIDETVSVNLFMAGGPSTAYGGTALEVFDQLSK